MLKRGVLSAFTLLEVCLAVFIAALLALAAVPSIQGLLVDQRLKKSFEKFDALVQEAQSRSVTERRVYEIVWDDDGVFVRPQESTTPDESRGVMRMDFAKKQSVEIKLPAALLNAPPKEWTFWPTGTCEPAVITGREEAGQWSAAYDPLTVRGTFLTQ